MPSKFRLEKRSESHLEKWPSAMVGSLLLPALLNESSGSASSNFLEQYQLKLPDGQITKKLSSPFARNILLNPSGKSALPARPVLSRQEGRIAIVTNAGEDAVDAAASARKVVHRAVFRERTIARRTNDVSCVRQNRVVLAPVAGVKLAEAKSAQPRLISPHPPTTVTIRIRRRGEHGISRQTMAQ